VTSGNFRFDRFSLDLRERQLRRNGQPVELSSRYFDALALLVREQGKLVSKDRFLDGVWQGVPVTDEALTQCIKTLRRQLGDDAARPRFIETVPKHGYRFIAPVDSFDAPTSGIGSGTGERLAGPNGLPEPLLLGLAGMIGGGLAGLFGGIFYGFAGASPGMGAVSILLVLVCLTIVVALIGAAGVALGIAFGGFASERHGLRMIAGGAFGGLVTGASVKLLGLDAFQLLLGQSPGDFTGASEGALLGAAVGAGAWLAGRGGGRMSVRRGVATGALAGGLAGLAIPLLGGRLLGGSLDLLAQTLPASRLRLDQIGALFGESGFGPVSQVVTGGLEGALFAGGVVGAMILARRNFCIEVPGAMSA
jgi:DNA-binding winged helix-turn-helix (wHTH) protein